MKTHLIGLTLFIACSISTAKAETLLEPHMTIAKGQYEGPRVALTFDACTGKVDDRILNALIDLENAVKSMPAANPKPNLLPLFARLDELTRQLPPQTAPDLRHYLHKKSYEKARLFLEGRDAENQVGNCRHV